MVHCSRMSIFCLLLSDAFFGKFKKKKKKQKSRKASISNDCYSTLLPVCDPDDIMPSQPCVNEDEQKKLKKPRGPITHTEVVRFLNKKLTYNAVSFSFRKTQLFEHTSSDRETKKVVIRRVFAVARRTFGRIWRSFQKWNFTKKQPICMSCAKNSWRLTRKTSWPSIQNLRSKSSCHCVCGWI